MVEMRGLWRTPMPDAARGSSRWLGAACVITGRLVWLAVVLPAAHASPSFSPAVLIAPDAIPGCTTMSAGAVAWVEGVPGLSGHENVDVAKVAAVGPDGPNSVEAVGPSTGTASCPALETAGLTTLAVADILLPPRSDVAALNTDVGELWTAAPGVRASDLGTKGLRPTVAAAPDGSSVIAWLAYAGKGPAGGPTYSLRVTQRAGAGAFGAPVTVAGPDSDDSQNIGPELFPLIVSPQAVMDTNGGAVVAWEPIEDNAAYSLVQASEAPPAGSFGPIETISPGDPVNGQTLANLLLLAGNGAGQHALEWAAWPSEDLDGLGLLTQSDLSSPFSSTAVPFAWPLEGQSPSPAHAALAMDAAGDIFELLSPDGDDTGNESGVLEYSPLIVIERRAGSVSWRAQTLVSNTGFDVAGDPVFAVRSDGMTAAAWVDENIGPYGGLVRDVQVSVAPPGKPFGAPTSLGGLAPIARQPAIAFGNDGRLRVAWVSDTQFGQSNGALVVSTEHAAGGHVTSPGPRPTLELRAARTQHSGNSVTVQVHSNPGTLVRVQAIILGINQADIGGKLLPDGGQGYPQLGGTAPDAVSRIVPSSGKATLRVSLADDWSAASQFESLPSGRYPVRLVAYATTQMGASSAATSVVRVPGGG